VNLHKGRKQWKAQAEQAEYDKWEEKTAIWEVPKMSLPSDHVANPRWNTKSQINAQKRREVRAKAGMLPENNDPKFAGKMFTTSYVPEPSAGTRTQMFAQKKVFLGSERKTIPNPSPYILHS